jgi:hypothetical protein
MRKIFSVAALVVLVVVLADGSPVMGWGVTFHCSGSPQEAHRETSLPPDLETIQKHSQSRVTLQTSKGPADVYLYARDQEVSTLKAPYCGGNEGDKESEGHFELISVRGGKIASHLTMDPDLFFVTEHPHNGLRVFTLPGNGQQLVKLLQYGSCNTERVQFYRLDPEGGLERVAFLSKDGRRFNAQYVGPSGEIHSSARNENVFCNYNNGIGRMLCDAYRYDGKNFVQTQSWMSADLPAVWKRPTPAAEAMRALYEFLSALAGKKFRVAAFYYARASFNANQGASASAVNSTSLKAYCLAAAGCLLPAEISKPLHSGSGELMEFTVSFVAPDFSSIQTNGENQIRFRVKRFASGFKVLDLPPRTTPSGKPKD